MLHHAQMSLQRPAHQRVQGAARLTYAVDRAGTTRLADLYQRAPCRVLFPDVEAGEPPQAVLLTTSGGLTSGDRLDVAIEAGAQAQLTVSTQAAEKLYRALPGEPDAEVSIKLTAGAGASLEWLAQETILFDRARLRRELQIDLHDSARLLATESIVFGRRAMGETHESGRLHDAWRVRRNGRLVWADALRVDGDTQRLREAAFGLGQAQACATVLYAGPDAAAHLSILREQLPQSPSLAAAATSFDDVLIVRVLSADAAAVREAVRQTAATLRHAALGRAAVLPRVWSC